MENSKFIQPQFSFELFSVNLIVEGSFEKSFFTHFGIRHFETTPILMVIIIDH